METGDLGNGSAWQLFQMISFVVGDFQDLLWDDDFHFSDSPQYAEAPSGASYSTR